MYDVPGHSRTEVGLPVVPTVVNAIPPSYHEQGPPETVTLTAFLIPILSHWATEEGRTRLRNPRRPWPRSVKFMSTISVFPASSENFHIRQELGFLQSITGLESVKNEEQYLVALSLL